MLGAKRLGAKKAAVLALFVAALAAGVALARSLGQADGPALGSFHGVRLGMTASTVRERFEAPALGAWQSVPQTGAGDVVLAWAAAKGPAAARFELHSGLLVAVRAVVEPSDSDAARPSVEASHAVVRTRQEADGAVRITILARDCPTHHAEAERLAEGK
jgi:hypothetical protein